jgi:serine/threonine-protein kinase
MLMLGLPVLVSAQDTIVVTAEGLADPNADTYARDKGLLIDDLRRDARRQAIEKAVGVFVEGSTLVENYTLIDDRVLSESKGLIKRVIKESKPWVAEDGFVHMLIKAEVYLGGVEDALRTMSRQSRISYIRDYGNPRISVAVLAQDADRGSRQTRSDIAENLLKERISAFGYRVWSEDATQTLKTEMMESSSLSNQTETTVSVSHLKAADFSIVGRVRFDVREVKLSSSGIRLKKHLITSWTVKCINNNTGEEIYFNNKIPRHHSWATEDQALEDVGRMIGQEFSKDFFESHLVQPSHLFELRVIGLPSYDIGVLLKREMIGLRPFLDVALRNYSTNGLTSYEVNFVGGQDSFAQTINSAVIQPLNAKFGAEVFSVNSLARDVVTLVFTSDKSEEELISEFNSKPPAALANASPARIARVAQDEETLKKVEAINPDAVAFLADQGAGGDNAAVMNEINDF